MLGEHDEGRQTSSARTRVVFDSNVMFDPTRRYALLSLVVNDAFDTRWTRELIDEWSRVIVREGRTSAEKAAYQRAKLLADFPYALVEDVDRFESVAQMVVRDPGDMKVAACALAVAPCILLTFNMKHFDVERLQEHGVTVRKPGPWLAESYHALEPSEQNDWCLALEGHRLTTHFASRKPEAYLTHLGENARGLSRFVTACGAEFLSLPRSASMVRESPIIVQDEGYRQIVRLISNPPAPTPALYKLMRGVRKLLLRHDKQS